MYESTLIEYVMRALVALLALATFAAAPLVRAADTTTSPTPQASVSPGKKHSKKKATTTATSTAGTNSTASASPTKPAKGVPTPQAAQAAGGGAGKVWVNTETHVYHKEGSKWYGRTKKGKYLSEQDAINEGDKAAKNEK
jgi:Ni/Co efflux regulator RcnB